MWLGLDVGGTHTDAVIVNEGGVVSSVKVATDHHNLINSIKAAFTKLLEKNNHTNIARINLSTTLSTNAIVEGKTEKVGVIVSSGPGINPAFFSCGEQYHVIDGSIDHRGKEVKTLNAEELQRAVEACQKNGVKVFAAVSKFSTRNPSHEEHISDACTGADFITMGHRLSGNLGFPRRIATSYFNSAVWRLFNSFADAVEKNLADLHVKSPVHILKADGGTLPLSEARHLPVESILSGPAASVMGISALCNISADAVALDIGGTTTDISLYADGEPLVEPHGISLGALPTLVRSLATRSIGIGGDSAIRLSDGALRVGPERIGPSMAEGGSVPTLLDALNFAGNAHHGDTVMSKIGIEKLAQEAGITPQKLTSDAIALAVKKITDAVDSLLKEINDKPVYTIHEMLEGKVITPKALYVMGGPAHAFAPLMEKAFRLPVIVPEHYLVANAIGAALARTTFDLTLLADTERQKLIVPNIGINETCDRNYALEKAKKDARSYLMSHLKKMGIAIQEHDAQIVEESSFNMVGGFYTTGKNIRVRCQVKPAVEVHLHSGGGR